MAIGFSFNTQQYICTPRLCQHRARIETALSTTRRGGTMMGNSTGQPGAGSIGAIAESTYIGPA